MDRRRRYLVVLGGAAGALAMAVAILGGAAVTGQAATMQTVVATRRVPAGDREREAGSTIGCVLTVHEQRRKQRRTASFVTRCTASDGGTFRLPSNSSLCTIRAEAHADMQHRQAALGSGANVRHETHELQRPESRDESVTQTGRRKVLARRSGNNRGSDAISFAPDPYAMTTTLDNDDRLRWQVRERERWSVQTGRRRSRAAIPYSTGAKLVGTTGFAAGLSVRERRGCRPPTTARDGCFGGQVIDFKHHSAHRYRVPRRASS